MAWYELPPYSPTSIAGAKEVWDNGGKVIVVGLELKEDGTKWSTTDLERVILGRAKSAERSRYVWWISQLKMRLSHFVRRVQHIVK